MDTRLDALENIRELDPDDMKGVVEDFKVNLERAREIVEDFARHNREKIDEWKNNKQEISQIVVVGMGGSAIGGNLLVDYLYDRLDIPVSVFREYKLPKFIDDKCLIIFISYSGNTEETLSSFADANSRKCKILSITSGGNLASFSSRLKIPVVTLPGGLPPRGAIPLLSLPLFLVLEKIGLISGVSTELNEVLNVVKRKIEQNKVEIPISENIAKQAAIKIHGSIPLIYAPAGYASVARRFKCQFNENSKSPSYWDVFSELNHNEVVGWQVPSDITKSFTVLLLRTADENDSIRARIELTKEIMLKPAVKDIVEIHAEGSTKLAIIYSLIIMGDFISYYLAILNGVDPSPVPGISRLKKELKDRVDLIEKIEKDLF